MSTSVLRVDIHVIPTLIVTTLLVLIPVSVEVVILGMANLVLVCILYKKIVISKIIFVESNIIEPIAIELNL